LIIEESQEGRKEETKLQTLHCLIALWLTPLNYLKEVRDPKNIMILWFNVWTLQLQHLIYWEKVWEGCNVWCRL